MSDEADKKKNQVAKIVNENLLPRVPIPDPSRLFARSTSRKFRDVAYNWADATEAVARQKRAENELERETRRSNSGLIDEEIKTELAKQRQQRAEAEAAFIRAQADKTAIEKNASGIADARVDAELSRAVRQRNIAAVTKDRSEWLLDAIRANEAQYKETRGGVEKTRLELQHQRLMKELRNLQRDVALIEVPNNQDQPPPPVSSPSVSFTAALRQLLEERGAQPGVEHRTFGHIHEELQWHTVAADRPPITGEDWYALAEQLHATGEHDWIDEPRLITYIQIMTELIEANRVPTSKNSS